MRIPYVIDNQMLKLGDVLPRAQLVWMDAVIDQIVYRLYGLGAEEIRVVEGKR